jgi:hypothetical protein
MRAFSTVVLVAPLFSALSLFSACVGSDAPAVAGKIDSSVPPVNDGGTPADVGADGPAVEVDAGPKRCTADQAFETNAILLDIPTPTPGVELRGGRPVANVGTVFALVGGLKNSKLFVLPPGGSANDAIPIETTTGAVLSSADIRVEGAANVRIVFSEGDMPIHPDNFGDRAMKAGKLTLTNGTYKISEVTVFGGNEIDQAEAQLVPEGILMSYRAFDGGAVRRKIRLLEGALSASGITARDDVFAGPSSETSPYKLANGNLYFATLDESQLVTGIRARRPDATIANVPVPLPQAAWKGGVTWVSPDECELWYNAPKSPTDTRSVLWRAARKPK